MAKRPTCQALRPCSASTLRSKTAMLPTTKAAPRTCNRLAIVKTHAECRAVWPSQEFSSTPSRSRYIGYLAQFEGLAAHRDTLGPQFGLDTGRGVSFERDVRSGLDHIRLQAAGVHAKGRRQHGVPGFAVVI